MNRLLFLIAVATVVYLLIRSFRTRGPGAGRPGGGPSGSPPSGYAEDMVRCIYCGVHLPRSEAIMSGGKYYCCEAHRQAHQSFPADRNGG